MGSAVFEIGDILEIPGKSKGKKLKGGGILYATIDPLTDKAKGRLFIRLSGVNIKNVEGLLGGKSDPFFEFNRKEGDFTRLAYRSQVKKNNLNPDWGEVKIDVDYLCGSNFDQPFAISIYDHEKSSKHRIIGSLSITVKAMLKAYEKAKPLTILHGTEKTGQLKIHSFRLTKDGKETTVDEYHVLEEMMKQKESKSKKKTENETKGQRTTKPKTKTDSSIVYSKDNPPHVQEYMNICDLSLAVAIDFSGSNGDPSKPGTLHEVRNDGKLNDYEEAITAVASILSKLDEDEIFPVWGFGVKFGGKVQNCFQVGPNEEVQGLKGILEAYRGMFKKPLTMSGPTDITGVIEHAAKSAKQKFQQAIRNNMISFTILLILTDGSLNDVNKTMACLAESSQAPLSIIIVGIGRSEFAALKFVDEFTVQGAADICQFIEFEMYKRNTKALIRATLEEIPEQIINFFMEKNIYPNSDFEEMETPFIEEPDAIEGSVCSSIRSEENALRLESLDVHKNAFKVQVAPGVSPGTHISVESPYTRKQIDLKVPFGVPPGGTFVVNG